MAPRQSQFDPDKRDGSVSKLVRRTYNSLSKEAAKSKWLSYSCQAAATVLVPIAVGYCVNLVTSDDTTKQAIGWTALTGVVILQATLIIGLLVGPSTPASVIQDLDDLSREQEEWIARARSLSQVGGAFATAKTCSSEAAAIALGLLQAQDSRGALADIGDDLGRLIAPYIELRHEALNFSRARGRYTFTIFELSGDSTILAPRFRHRDEGIADRGRHLPVARSHAGQAVLNQKTLITDDAAVADEFLEVYDLEDRQNYRSMASFPVFVRGEVFGAGTITCDAPSQFGADGADVIFDTLGGIISLYLSSRYCEPNGKAQIESVEGGGPGAVAEDPTGGAPGPA